MSHCNRPETCSVCLGAVPRVVELRDGVTYVDNVPVAVTGETATSTPQPRSTKHRYGKRRK